MRVRVGGTGEPQEVMYDCLSSSRPRLTLCLAALALAALTGPVAGLPASLAPASSTALTFVAAALVGATWPSSSPSPSPSRASSGPARTATASPSRSAVAVPQRGTTGPRRGRTAGSYCSTIVALAVLTTWRHPWLQYQRGVGANVVPGACAGWTRDGRGQPRAPANRRPDARL